MRVKGESIFMAVRSGTSKAGKPFYTAKFLDKDADEFYTIFIDEDMYNDLKEMQRSTPVLLTIDEVIGSKYISLVSVEEISVDL